MAPNLVTELERQLTVQLVSAVPPKLGLPRAFPRFRHRQMSAARGGTPSVTRLHHSGARLIRHASCAKPRFIIMVDIHLNIPESRDPFISIPNSDVRRLSKRPFKWLRFVMFCICGARGDLSATPDGPPVDYDSTSFSDVYYYNPSGKISYCV